jgi:RNA-directed DNA polymerase
MRGYPAGSEQALNEEKPVAKGDQRRQLWVDEQSYDFIVPMKVENRRAPARGGHGIHWREGMNRLGIEAMPQVRDTELEKVCQMELQRIAELAKQDAGRRFYSIAHFLTKEALWEAFDGLRKDAAAGVDGVTYAEYREHLVENLSQLHEKLKSTTYRAQPLRRIYIDKEDGRKRPISIPALEDKVVQRAVVKLLNAIFEQDFLDCSKGFRPGRSAHDALDEVGRVICRTPTQWVLEIDICSYFDSIVRKQLMEMVERRVSDASILRLISKWINVGVIDEGKLLMSETGTGQGQVVSPLLANIYLHHVLDVWFEAQVKPRVKGQAYLIRFADDAILCFQYREDAQRVLEVLHKRFAKFGLQLHSEKTRLVEFGRRAHERATRMKAKTETFDFLGLTHRCATSRKGKFTVKVGTMKKRLKRGLKAVSEWCRQHRHDPVGTQQRQLNAKLRGHYQYYGRPTNYRSLWKFFRAVRRIWRMWLERRTRGKRLDWEVFAKLLARHPLLRPRITHAWSPR